MLAPKRSCQPITFNRRKCKHDQRYHRQEAGHDSAVRRERSRSFPSPSSKPAPAPWCRRRPWRATAIRLCSWATAKFPPRRSNKAAKGHFDKADVAPKKTLREFRLDDISAMNVGDILKADVFAAGDKIDVVGVSKGKGYQGAIKRWNGHRSAREPRHRPCGPPCRLHGLLLHSFPRVQGQEAARPHGCGAGHRPEPDRC